MHVVPRNVGKPNIVRSHCPTPRWRPLQIPIKWVQKPMGIIGVCFFVAWTLLHDPTQAIFISFCISRNVACVNTP